MIPFNGWHLDYMMARNLMFRLITQLLKEILNRGVSEFQIHVIYM
jgi:hypothetical protein